jgi:hypothetical protein
MVLFDVFFRRHGVRRALQLQAPPMSPMMQFTLPQLSVLHYVSDSALDKYPQADDWMFHDYPTAIMVDSVTTLASRMGNPRQVLQPQALVKALFSKVKRFRQLRDPVPYENSKNTLLVINYGLLNSIYQYQRNVFSSYHKWQNIQASVWSKIAEMTQASRREHFLAVKLPTTLPSQQQLNLASTGLTTSMLHVFDDSAHFFLLEIWTWLGLEREKSLISKVSEDHLKLVNLVFQEAGRFTVINLGELNSWREHVNERGVKTGIPPVQLQRRFLHFCMSLSEAESVASDAPQADEPGLQVPSEVNNVPVEDQNVMVSGITDQGGKRKKAQADATVLDDGHDSVIHPDQVDSDRLDLTEAEMAKLEADLFELERVAQHVESVKTETAAAMHRLKEIEAHSGGPEVDSTAKPKVLHPGDDVEIIPIEHDTPTPAYNPHQAANHALAAEAAIEELVPTLDSPEDGVKQIVENLSSKGLMSAAEQRRYLAQAVRYKEIAAPLDHPGQTLDEFRHVDPQIIQMKVKPSIPDISTVADKSMLQSSLMSFDSQYTKHVMQRDVAGMVLNLQKAGLCVTDYEVDFEETLLGSAYNYTVRVNPVEGAPSTLRFKLPHVEEDGTYMANGVKYVMRKQRGDVPIRKTSDDTVSLTSYYGKLMVTRSSKKVNDLGYWLRSKMTLKALDKEDYSLYDVRQNNVFNFLFKAPKLYSDIAKGFSTFSVTSQVPINGVEKVKFHFIFDAAKRETFFDKDVLLQVEMKGGVICGSDEHHTKYIVMDHENNLHLVGTNSEEPLPSFFELLGLDMLKAPVDYTEMKVMGLKLPLAIILGYYLGLEKLLGALRAHNRIVPVGRRMQLGPTEYVLRFEDMSLILDRRDRFATMILAGFNGVEKQLRHYSLYDFSRKGVYLNLIEAMGGNSKQIREMDLMQQLFIDPITKELLIEMHEPLNFVMLLLRANELLLDNTHPSELDPAYMRIKGYERFAGAAYGQLVRSIRAHSGKPGRAKQAIELHPYEVWSDISEDPSKNQAVETNPIQELKEREAVTYAGHGGRNSRTMVKHTRAYHENDMGTISEATVDSGDVGINIFTSADPQFQSLRGISKRWKGQQESGIASVVSTSFLNGVGIDRDDAKRANFVQIQNGHMLACDGYHVSPVRTGYEQIIAHRTGDLYATTAKQSGTILSINEHGMVVQYDDGSKKAIELGLRYGSAAGLTVPHTVVAGHGLKAGDTFSSGDILAYNTGYFDYDPLNPKQVAFKGSVMARVALMECPLTLEDSCMISQGLAEKLKTGIAQPRTIVLDFKQAISHLVEPGITVSSDDILCVIEDAVSANQSLFSQTSLDTLRALQAQTPVAKYAGTIERIEVFYHGELEDMSESLRALAKWSDSQLAKRAKSLGKSVRTGQVDEGFRTDGNPLLLDTMAIRIYILNDAPMGVGDKTVFGNQMKSVVGRVSQEDIRTESGLKLDAIFGAKSVDARIVGSFDIIGTTAPLLRVATERAVAAYLGT